MAALGSDTILDLSPTVTSRRSCGNHKKSWPPTVTSVGTPTPRALISTKFFVTEGASDWSGAGRSAAALARCFELLSADQRRGIELAFVDGASHADIARVTQQPVAPPPLKVVADAAGRKQ